MNPCNECAVNRLRYLDNDLKGQELEDFRSHLESCGDCRAHLQAEKALSQTLDRSRPLYSAPAALRERLAAMAVQHSLPDRIPDRAGPPTHQNVVKRLSGALERFWSLRILAPATVVIALSLSFVPEIVHHVKAASYVATAVAMHRNYLRGNLPFGLQSNSPQAVTAWFADKVPFQFRLPAESAPEKNPAYRLTGAALANYKGKPAALVTYETHKDKISLLVDSASSAIVAGGDVVQAGKLTFHYYNASGLRVITWSNHGLSYALVSSVSGPARASCLACHQDMADRTNFNASGNN